VCSENKEIYMAKILLFLIELFVMKKYGEVEA
jgi:hypothetical protein